VQQVTTDKQVANIATKPLASPYTWSSKSSSWVGNSLDFRRGSMGFLCFSTQVPSTISGFRNVNSHGETFWRGTSSTLT
jgi:hypothetical protein